MGYIVRTMMQNIREEYKEMGRGWAMGMLIIYVLITIAVLLILTSIGIVSGFRAQPMVTVIVLGCVMGFGGLIGLVWYIAVGDLEEMRRKVEEVKREIGE